MTGRHEGGGVRLHTATVLVLVVGVVVTAALSLAAWSAHQDNEDRLVEERVREAGAVLTSSVPGIETLLGSAAIVAEAGGEDHSAVRAMLEAQVGPGGQFTSVSMWDVADLEDGPLWTLGTPPSSTIDTGTRIGFLADASEADGLSVLDQLSSQQPSLGYGFSAPGASFVLFAEALLPEDRTSADQSGGAFADLAYALYLGDEPATPALLISSTSELPLSGRTATESVEFGDTSLLLVMSPIRDLSGDLLGRLWLVVVVAGLAVTGSVATLTERALRGRDSATALAAENERLYEGQRTVAEALQQSLLPDRLPAVPGVEVASQYRSGTTGIDVGGDWYDLIVHGSQVLLVVGDVSGRGVAAATTMGSLRHAFRAYAALGMGPGEILTYLNDLEFTEMDGQFATVVCAAVDVDASELSAVSAGHPPLLIVSDEAAEFARIPVQMPIGVAAGTRYRSTTVSVPAGATVLGYTDGLFERRAETLDVGMERLRLAAERATGPLEQRMEFIVDTLLPDGAEDDTAVLGVTWTA